MNRYCVTPAIATGLVVGCIGAIGQDAAESIATLQGDDEAARIAAKQELVRIGPEAVEPLLELVLSDDPKIEQAARQTLRHLALKWSDTPERREQVSAPLVKMATGKYDPVIRRLALDLLGKAADERVTPQIVDLLRDSEVAFDAVRALQHIPRTDPTAALAVALPDSEPELQVAILHALGARGDKRSVSDIVPTLKSQNAEVRAAAAEALGRIGDVGTLDDLLAALDDQEDTVHAAAVDACLRTARELAEAGQEGRAREVYESVLKVARAEPGTIGALTGIGAISDAKSVDAIRPLLKHESRRVKIAAAAALGRLPGARATTALADALRGASSYVAIAGLQALGNRGDAEALAAVRSLASDPSREVRMKALWALGRLRSAAAIPDLKAATTDDDEEIRLAALDAYLRLAGDLAEAGRTEDARGIYEDLAKLRNRGSHRSAAIAGLGAIGSAESLPVLARVLEDAEGDEIDQAFAAYAAICGAMLNRGEKQGAADAYGAALEWVPALADLDGAELDVAWARRSTIAEGLLAAGATEQAKELYYEALEALPADQRLADVGGKLTAMGEAIDMARVQGFVRKWWVTGPFPNEDWGGWDAAYPPEEKVDVTSPVEFEGRELAWQERTTDSHLDLMGPFGGEPATTEKACYAYAEFLVQEAQPVILKIGSDDAVKVWLNGGEIHANRVDRGATVDQDVVNSNVRAGVNTLLCKVLNNRGGWGIVVRLCDARGRALKFTQDIGGGGEAKIPFEKVRLADGSGLIECCTVLDVNEDGKLDIASGGFWYEAPDWTPREYREVTNDGNYANDWAEFALDVNGDGWTDIVSGGFHTEEISWYENPQGKDEPWKKHLAWSRGGEFYETLSMLDIDDDGQGDFLPNAGAPIRWYEVVRREGAEPEFVRHDIGQEGAGHGIGYGDVNGDGRTDIVCPAGWWEAPEDRREGEWAWHAEWNIGAVSVPILAHDVNGDGLADIIWGAGHPYGLFWLEQRRDGDERSWQQHTIDASFSQAHAPELADMDGDGDLDIVVGKRWKAHCGNDPGSDDPLYVYWFDFDRETGEWSRWVISYDDGAGIGLQQSLVDIDGDADVDVVSACKTGLHLFVNQRVK